MKIIVRKLNLFRVKTKNHFLDHLKRKEENLDFQKLVDVVSTYLFTMKEPRADELIQLMNERPKLKERASASARIKTKIMDFVETFIEGMG